MRDVAALAGVGIKTVSRVVNDVPTVAPHLVERVNDAAAKLGYRPNLTASSLRRSDRRTSTIGLLLENVANPFSGAMHRAVEDVARARGVLMLTGSVDEDPAQERSLTRALIDRGVDGLLVVPAGTDHSYLVGEQRAGTQIVFLDRNPSLVAADTIRSDHYEGATGAVNHLIAAGHRRIAYLGDRTDISTARDRHTGYVEALRTAGIGISDALVRHDLSTVEQAEIETRTVLELADPPTALFTSQNLVTIGALRALRAAGLRNRIAHVGFRRRHAGRPAGPRSHDHGAGSQRDRAPRGHHALRTNRWRALRRPDRRRADPAHRPRLRRAAAARRALVILVR